MSEMSGVGGARDTYDARTSGQPPAKFLGSLHLDRLVGGAVEDDGRTRDLAEAIGDVVSIQQAVARLAHAVARQLPPLRYPDLVQHRIANDQVGYRLSQFVDGSDLEPRLLHLAVGGQALGVLNARLSVDQHERSDPVGVQERRA